MQYVFLIRSSAGGKKYVTRRSFIANLSCKISTIFYAKNMGLFIADVVWT